MPDIIPDEERMLAKAADAFWREVYDCAPQNAGDWQDATAAAQAFLEAYADGKRTEK